MPNEPGVWGIDLGQCALKALRLQDIGGQVTATTFDYVEHPKILSQPDADPDQLTREALLKFLSRNTLKGDTVVISVPGQAGLARFVKLPPVEEKKIADIVRFEAKQQIPFNLDEVVWDYQKLGQGTVTDGFAMETEIGLFAMKRDMINRYIQHFKEVGVEVHIVQMAPLALCNFVAFDLLGHDPGAATEGEEEKGEKGCVVALDIGADASNLIITDGGRIIWQRPIPLGGNHFTRALTKDLKLTFAKAEHLKRNATKSPDLKKILAALKPVLNDFVSEVQRSLAFFANTHRDAHVDYMIGLGNAFRLPGLQKYLAEKLTLDVRKLVKMERLPGDAVVTQQVYTENILSFGVAYGLALQGLHRSRLVTNLLPGEIRIERLVRAKKPWAVTAAAALLLGCGAFTLSYYLDDRPYSPADPRIRKALDDSKHLVDRVNEAENNFKKRREDALRQEEAVKSIVAGQMERSNWLELLTFIDTVIPRPDASNLNPDAKKRYFIRRPDPKTHPNAPQHLMTGEQAWVAFQAVQKGEKPPGSEEEGQGVLGSVPTPGDELPPFIDDLIQVNIEAIDCRYCGQLQQFWVNVAGPGKPVEDEELVRPTEQFSTPPTGGGWVIELRGYTWHHKAQAFLRDTLLDNIARLGKALPPVAAPAPAAGSKTAPPAKGAAATAKAPVELPDVISRVSHACLYKAVRRDRCPPTAAFELISTSQVQRAVGSAALKPAGKGGAAVGPQRGTGKGPSGGGDGNFASLVTSSLKSNVTATGQEAGEGTGSHVRTEFIILFVWQEPTPSDQLRGMR